MKQIIVAVIDAIRHDLRVKRHVSIYATAKASGLRPDVILRIEQGEGGLKHFCTYIESYCKSYPDDAYRIFYGVPVVICDRYK